MFSIKDLNNFLPLKCMLLRLLLFSTKLNISNLYLINRLLIFPIFPSHCLNKTLINGRQIYVIIICFILTNVCQYFSFQLLVNKLVLLINYLY